MRSQFVIHLPAQGSGADALVEVDGVDITDKINAIQIKASAGGDTNVYVSYVAADVTFTGEGELLLGIDIAGEEE